VAEGVVQAIERNRAEVEVAPRIQRALAHFAHRRPEIAGRIAYRRGPGGRIADEVARGQTDKR
jgi:hypothetical protein